MKSRNENGGSLVEFALISPLLFVILFGIIEFGFLLYDKAVLTNACREGARAGIVYADTRLTAEEITGVVTSYCGDYLISFGGNTPTVDVTPGGAAGDPLTVTVNYTYQFLVFAALSELLGGSTDGTINLSAQSVMRLE